MKVVRRNTTRLCSSKPIIVVNGKFPGPTLYAREDDNVIVRVVNHVTDNVTIHWCAQNTKTHIRWFHESKSVEHVKICAKIHIQWYICDLIVFGSKAA